MASMLRPLADDGAVHPLAVLGVVVLVVGVVTATVYLWTSVFTAEAGGSSLPSLDAQSRGEDGREAWIELVVLGDGSVEEAELDVTVRGPEGTEVSTPCAKPFVVADGGPCLEPFEEGTFSRGRALWLPCQAEGPHLVTVAVRGSLVLDTETRCSGLALPR